MKKYDRLSREEFGKMLSFAKLYFIYSARNKGGWIITRVSNYEGKDDTEFFFELKDEYILITANGDDTKNINSRIMGGNPNIRSISDDVLQSN